MADKANVNKILKNNEALGMKKRLIEAIRNVQLSWEIKK